RQFYRSPNSLVCLGVIPGIDNLQFLDTTLFDGAWSKERDRLKNSGEIVVIDSAGKNCGAEIFTQERQDLEWVKTVSTRHQLPERPLEFFLVLGGEWLTLDY